MVGVLEASSTHDDKALPRCNLPMPPSMSWNASARSTPSPWTRPEPHRGDTPRHRDPPRERQRTGRDRAPCPHRGGRTPQRAPTGCPNPATICARTHATAQGHGGWLALGRTGTRSEVPCTETALRCRDTNPGPYPWTGKKGAGRVDLPVPFQRFPGAGSVQRPPADEPPQLGRQSCAGSKLARRPPGDIEEWSVQRSAGQLDVVASWHRARVWVVMIPPVDPPSHDLFVHVRSLPTATDTAGEPSLPAGRLTG